MPKPGGGSKLRYQIAGLCLAAAIILLFMAYRFDTRDFLISTPLNQRLGPGYTRMWFDSRDVLAGAIQRGAKLNSSDGREARPASRPGMPISQVPRVNFLRDRSIPLERRLNALEPRVIFLRQHPRPRERRFHKPERRFQETRSGPSLATSRASRGFPARPSIGNRSTAERASA